VLKSIRILSPFNATIVLFPLIFARKTMSKPRVHKLGEPSPHRETSRDIRARAKVKVPAMIQKKA
jgi:hypothetical protein